MTHKKSASNLGCALSLVIMTLSISSRAGTYYVDALNGNDDWAGTNWTTAVKSIQVAVDMTAPGDLVVASNGVYNTGGKVTPGYVLTNRVMINKAITLQSVNGPELTSIAGSGPQGASAVRCVYLTNNPTLIGFTLSNTYTMSGWEYGVNGTAGAVLCDMGGVISNCVICYNYPWYAGGGIYFQGGGTSICCRIISNSCANSPSGGIYCQGGTAISCLIARNGTTGGVRLNSGGSLKNCTIAYNTGVGIRSQNGGAMVNCIVYFNTTTNWIIEGTSPTYNYTCIMPTNELTGQGNITNNPLFAEASADNWRLNSASSCIDSGTNETWMTNSLDLDGKQRIFHWRVDMGAYEYEFRGTIVSLY